MSANTKKKPRPFPANYRPEYLRLIRETRLGAGMTQAELAFRAGIEPSEFKRLERGRGLMTVEQLRDIAAVLDCHPAEFFE
jgi:transcriptional regulator with XRE-family HTH domain